MTSISPNSHPIAIKFGRVVLHTHELTCITTDQMVLQQIKRKLRKTSRKSLLFSLKFSATTVSQGVETHNHANLFSGGGPVIYQVHEHQKTLIIRHKELSILYELCYKDRKREAITWCQVFATF